MKMETDLSWKTGAITISKFSNGICSGSENLILEAKNYLQMLDKQGDLIQEQVLSEYMKVKSIVY